MSFHVPEEARIATGRVASEPSDGNNGAFLIGSPEPGWYLFAIASDGLGWEHVSLRAERIRREGATRIPTWKEMAFAKRLFWDGEDVVVQFHPRESEYVNAHPHVLHLWRPLGVELPTPDPMLVGKPS